jgi:Calcineurin-like phosphoesterase
VCELESILHLSDLHRSKTEPLDNDALIGALMADRGRYLVGTPPVPSPSAVVVSGDLVQGALLDDLSFNDTLASQYSDAYELLSRLADKFLDGDRSQFVVVPGNHDVCWNTSIAAMEQVDLSEIPQDLWSAINNPGSDYRWSWKHQRLYRIRDKSKYNTRLENYWKTIHKFYDGTTLPISFDTTRGFNIFEICQQKIIVAAFDTTESNDCFCYIGEISPGIIARCAMAINEQGKDYKLKMAVWHHSTQGPPRHADYMDVDSVYTMIGHGFSLGLHGHQHISATGSYSIHLPDKEKMAVVSAGSVCAGSRELPRGINRQYNVLVLEDEFQTARVHVREMTNGGHFAQKTSGDFLFGYVSLNLGDEKVLKRHATPLGKSEVSAIFEAEGAIKNGKANDALIALNRVKDRSNGYRHRLSIEANQILGNWPELLNEIGTPVNESELNIAIEANLKLPNLERAQNLFDEYNNLFSNKFIKNEMQGRISTYKLLRDKNGK